jgi:hypothetical protein
MASSIEELVRMNDSESLNEIMNEHKDWMMQLDAAEGLVKLNDPRGLEFLLVASESDDEDVATVAEEILQTPAARRLTEQLENKKRALRAERIEKARLRLQQNKKVFAYRVVYVVSGDILLEDPLREGFGIDELEQAGLEGWEVVGMMPRKKQTLISGLEEHTDGVYFFLKLEVTSPAELPAD